MGKPMPGIEDRVSSSARGGRAFRELGPGEIGELALRPGWPSMMRAYLHEEARYDKCFVGGWYLSGDLANARPRTGISGYVGRADDLHQDLRPPDRPVRGGIGPHRTRGPVAEAGVIGIRARRDRRARWLKAYVTLNPGFEASDDLGARGAGGTPAKKLGPAVAPREIVFSQDPAENPLGARSCAGS